MGLRPGGLALVASWAPPPPPPACGLLGLRSLAYLGATRWGSWASQLDAVHPPGFPLPRFFSSAALIPTLHSHLLLLVLPIFLFLFLHIYVCYNNTRVSLTYLQPVCRDLLTRLALLIAPGGSPRDLHSCSLTSLNSRSPTGLSPRSPPPSFSPPPVPPTSPSSADQAAPRSPWAGRWLPPARGELGGSSLTNLSLPLIWKAPPPQRSLLLMTT